MLLCVEVFLTEQRKSENFMKIQVAVCLWDKSQWQDLVLH